MIPGATDYSSPYNIAPARFPHLFEIGVLIVIVAGDVVAFYQLAALAMREYNEWLVYILIIALSAAATVSMHQAGVWARARRSDDRRDVPGPWWFVVIAGGWLGMGATALWFRIESLRASAESVTPAFGTASTAPTPTWPLAVLMLMLYLVGGATAYSIGFRMHNPARAAYHRALRAQRKAEEEHDAAMKDRDREATRSISPGRVQASLARLSHAPPVPEPPLSSDDDATSAAEVELAQDHPQSTQEGAANPAVSDPDKASVGDEAESWLRDTGDLLDEYEGERPTADAREDTDRVDLERELELRLRTASAQADAHAAQLRELARHRLASALADPARSSGVFIRDDELDFSHGPAGGRQ